MPNIYDLLYASPSLRPMIDRMEGRAKKKGSPVKPKLQDLLYLSPGLRPVMDHMEEREKKSGPPGPPGSPGSPGKPNFQELLAGLINPNMPGSPPPMMDHMGSNNPPMEVGGKMPLMSRIESNKKLMQTAAKWFK